MTFFIQLVINGILTGGMYALMALAVVIVYKSSSVFNFAHGSLVALVSFVFWQLMVPWQMPIWLTLPLLIVFIAIVSILIQRLILQPLTGQSLMSAIMATIALGEVFNGAVVLFWPGPGRLLPKFVTSTTHRLGAVHLSSESLVSFLVCAVCFIVFLIFFHRTKFGLAMRGTAEDHTLAQSEGIRVSRVFVVSWFVAIAIAGVGGVLMGSLFGLSFEPLHGLGMKALAVVILGGLESILGALIGGIAIGVAEALASGFVDPLVGGGASDIVPYIVLLVALIFKPYGLFGYERIERV